MNANVMNSEQQTPMHHATFYGNRLKVNDRFREDYSWISWNFPGSEEVAKLLIEKGYTNQINSVDVYGYTPVHNAAAQGNCRYYFLSASQ